MRMGKRHVQIFLLFAAGFIAYGMRANMSVGIVAMMSEDPPDPSIPTYPEWTNKDTVLSSFFWGYVVFQIGAGQIAEKYGPKYFLLVTLTIASIFSILIPCMAAEFGSVGVIINRVIQGLCQGFLFPSTHCLMSKWTPLAERSRIAGFVYTAGPLGTSVSMILTGIISDTKFGWPYVFYLYGCLGLIWVGIYFWLGYNCPSDHKSISIDEKNYIEENTKVSKDVKQISSRTPWKSFFTSMPVWAILISHVGNNWGFWTLLTEIPSFMSSVLNYDIKKNGEISAIPYFGYCIVGLLLGPISDFVIGKRLLSLGNSRKLFNCFGFFLPAISLIGLGYVPKNNDILAVILLILAVSTNAGMLIGFNVNHIDISPNFAGTLMGITNCAANFASIIGPKVVEYIVTDPNDETLWRLVFMISAGVYIASGIFFVIFGSGEIQSWNDPKRDENETNKGETMKPKISA